MKLSMNTLYAVNFPSTLLQPTLCTILNQAGITVTDPRQLSTEVQFYFGWLYHLGEEIEANFAIAAQWYRLAAQGGHSLAQHNLNTLYRPRKILHKLFQQYGTVLCDYPDELAKLLRDHVSYQYQCEILISAINLGIVAELLAVLPARPPLSLFSALVQRLAESTGIKIMLADWAIQSWYVALHGSPQLGSAEAQFSLGERYEQETPPALETAQVWYQLAAQQGQVEAQYRLGQLLEEQEEYTTSRHWYHQAAAQGHGGALFQLGNLAARGRGMAQDYQTAMNCYMQAANQGHLLAQFNLGVMYANGLGVNLNLQESVKWFKLAAQQGEEVAQCILGVMYAHGVLDLAPDLTEATKWFQLAASQGNGLAQNYQVN